MQYSHFYITRNVTFNMFMKAAKQLTAVQACVSTFVGAILLEMYFILLTGS